MKEISRRRFLRTSALAGAAAVLAGTASLGANAASPAPQPAADENCLGQLGTAIASLGNGSPVLPTVVAADMSWATPTMVSTLSRESLTARTSASAMLRRWKATVLRSSPPTP